jgi:hypothetical protein
MLQQFADARAQMRAQSCPQRPADRGRTGLWHTASGLLACTRHRIGVEIAFLDVVAGHLGKRRIGIAHAGARHAPGADRSPE